MHITVRSSGEGVNVTCNNKDDLSVISIDLFKENRFGMCFYRKHIRVITVTAFEE